MPTLFRPLALSLVSIAAVSLSGAPAERPSFALPSAAELAAAPRTVPAPAPREALSPEQFAQQARALVAANRPVDFDPAVRARELGDGVKPVFEYVRDRIRFEAYSGVLRGAAGAYASRAANAPDRALLLARMLEVRGVPTRFATGRLDAARSARLLGRMFAPVSGDEGAPSMEGAPAHAQAFARQVRIRALRDYATVCRALDGTLPAGDPGERDRLLEEISAHVWVQARVGEDWIDLDTAFAEGAPGKTFCEVEQTLERLPEEWHQRVTLRVVAERLSGGVLQSETSLEVELQAVDLLDHHVVLLHMPKKATPARGTDGLGFGGLGAGADDADSWVPVLWNDGHTTAGEPIVFGDRRGGGGGGFGALGGDEGGGDDGSVFVAEILEIVTTTPAGRPENVRRILVDRAGPAWRRATPLDPAGLAPLTRGREAPLAVETVHNLWFSSGRHDMAAYAKSMEQLAVAASAPKPGPSPAEPKEGAAELSGNDALAARLWPLAMQNLNVALWGDHAFLPGLNGTPGVRFYPDRPRILLFSFALVPGPDGSADDTMESVIDLRRDFVRGVAAEPAGAETVVRGKIWYGLLEGALEHEMGSVWGDAVPGGKPVVRSTSALAASDGARVLRPGAEDLDDWPRLAANRDAAAASAAALEQGDILVVPGPTPADSGWWAIAATTGDTRAVWGRDLNAAVLRSPLPRVGASRGGVYRVFQDGRSVDLNRYERQKRGGGSEYQNLVVQVAIKGRTVISITSAHLNYAGMIAGSALVYWGWPSK